MPLGDSIPQTTDPPRRSPRWTVFAVSRNLRPWRSTRRSADVDEAATRSWRGCGLRRAACLTRAA